MFLYKTPYKICLFLFFVFVTLGATGQTSINVREFVRGRGTNNVQTQEFFRQREPVESEPVVETPPVIQEPPVIIQKPGIIVQKPPIVIQTPPVVKKTAPSAPPIFPTLKVYKAQPRATVPTEAPIFVPTKAPIKIVSPQIITRSVKPTVAPTRGRFFTLPTRSPSKSAFTQPGVLTAAPSLLPSRKPNQKPTLLTTKPSLDPIAPPRPDKLVDSVKRPSDKLQTPTYIPDAVFLVTQNPSYNPDSTEDSLLNVPAIIPSDKVVESSPRFKKVSKDISPKQIPLRLTWSITPVEDSNPIAQALADDQEEFKESLEKAQAKKTTSETEEWTIEESKDRTPEVDLALRDESAVEDEPEEIEETITSVSNNGEIPIKDDVDRGVFIQLASYKREDYAKEASNNKSVRQVPQRDKLLIYKNRDSSYYKLLVGPFKRDEVGVELIKVQGSGFNDAFVYRP